MEIIKMKLRNVLLILLTVLIVVKVASADQESDLMGLGMPGPLASKVANPEDLDVTNNVTIGGTLAVTGAVTGASFAGTLDPSFTDGSVPYINSSGELAQDNAGFLFNASENNVYSQYSRLSSNAGVTAAGSAIGDATLLTNALNRVTTVGSGEGVKLPAVSNGTLIVVQNLGANDLELYPNGASGVLNGASAGGAITLAAATDDIAYCRLHNSDVWSCGVMAGPAT